MFDLSLALGWKLQDKAIPAHQFAGRLCDQQSESHYDQLSTDDPATGPFPGLNAQHKALWRGPWLGIAHEQQLNKKWALTLQSNTILPNFNGEAHWNLRNDLAHTPSPTTRRPTGRDSSPHWASITKQDLVGGSAPGSTIPLSRQKWQRSGHPL